MAVSVTRGPAAESQLPESHSPHRAPSEEAPRQEGSSLNAASSEQPASVDEALAEEVPSIGTSVRLPQIA